MKKLSLSLFAVCLAAGAWAQPILSTGFGYMARIDGNTYTKTTDLGTGNFPGVAASADGKYFYAQSSLGKLYFIDVATNAFVDSMNMNAGDMSAYNEPNILFKLSAQSLLRYNMQTKTLVDSIIIPGSGPFRLEERRGSKEVWVTVDSMIQVVNYSGTLTTTGIRISNNRFDNTDLRFTSDGDWAYKSANSRQHIFKVDAHLKVVTDSIDTSPYMHGPVEASTDRTKVYGAAGTKVYVYDANSKARIDSVDFGKQVMQLYRHPLKAEIWAVHHFDDSASVFAEAGNTLLGTVALGPDPFFLAFAINTVGVKDVNQTRSEVMLYPNPATHMLNIELHGAKARSIILLDAQGRTVLQATTTTAKASLDVAALAPGSYYMAIYQNGRLENTAQFVKQ